MSNLTDTPRPYPLKPKAYWLSVGMSIQYLLTKDALEDLFEQNEAWLACTPRSTWEIYMNLFRQVDPDGEYLQQIMECLNEALWNYGCTTEDHPRFRPWRWKMPQ